MVAARGMDEPAGVDLRTGNCRLRFTRFLATNLGVKAVSEELDELEDFRIATCLLNLLLCNLLDGLDGAEKDVELDSASVEGGLLRDEGDLLAVLINVELSDRLLIKLYGQRD